MHPGVSCPIDRSDPKHGLARSGRPGNPAFKLALRSGVSQGESPEKKAAVTPLPPNFEFVCIPETSGSERAPSEHLHFRPDVKLFSLLQNTARDRVQDIHDQTIQFDDDPFPPDIFPGDQQDGFGTFLNCLGVREGCFHLDLHPGRLIQ